MKSVDQYWYKKTIDVPIRLKFLVPLFWLGMTLRRWAYALRIFRSYKPKVPVIVVGNITVGGSGKSPVVIWLVNELKQAGYTPGIVSRGYKGQSETWPQQVRPDSDPTMVGDEPVLIARRCQVPMAVGPERVDAIKALMGAHPDINVIVSDDGMQHYAMRRDIEIGVIDGERRFGNGYLLPAGPLREPVRRLRKFDFLIVNGGKTAETVHGTEYGMKLEFLHTYNVKTPSKTKKIASIAGLEVDAVAGIGNPDRFFRQLSRSGVSVKGKHSFADHHNFEPSDLDFDTGRDVFMTEKDAVKCERFAQSNHWCVTVDASISEGLSEKILELLEKKISRRKLKWIPNYSTF